MSFLVKKRIYDAPPVSKKEIMRYLGCGEHSAELSALVSDCLSEAEDKLAYKVAFCYLPVHTDGERIDLCAFSFSSRDLCKSLAGSERVLLFGATLGIGIDRLIARYSVVSPARAVVFQAIGAERIEALCDFFCREEEIKTGRALRPRFSPGYGDLPLSVQRDVFNILDCQRSIGLTLNESLIMSPSKSVTAFAAVKEEI